MIFHCTGIPIRNDIPILSNKVSIHGSARVTQLDAPLVAPHCCNCQGVPRVRRPHDPLPTPDQHQNDGEADGEPLPTPPTLPRGPSLPLPPIRGAKKRASPVERRSEEYLVPTEMTSRTNFSPIEVDPDSDIGQNTIQLTTFKRD